MRSISHDEIDMRSISHDEIDNVIIYVITHCSSKESVT
jgi:hypothetical protein